MDAHPEDLDLPMRRLSPRGKLLRGTITVGVVLVAVILVLVLASRAEVLPLPWTEPGNGSVVKGHAPVPSGTGAWQQIALPVPGSSVSSFAADPAHPERIILCSDSTAAGFASTSATVWLTENSGRTWTSLPIPLVSSLYCLVSVIADNPTVLLLQAGSVPTEPACSNGVFYFSTDLGASWHHIPHSTIAPVNSQGECSVGGSGQLLYMLTFYTGYSPSSPANGSPSILLERSDDRGDSWHRVGLPYLQIQGIDLAPSTNGSVLLADMYGGGAPTPQLWITRNAGVSWTSEGEIPGLAMTLLSPPFAGTPSQTLPRVLYAVAGNQEPASLYHLSVFMAGSALSGPGLHWSVVPPLPIPGAQADRTGLTDILGALPDGRLLALGADPRKPLASAGVGTGTLAGQQQWLWIWDPVSMRWESANTPSRLVWPESCAALCWQAQISSAASGVDGPQPSGYDLNLMTDVQDAAQHPLYRLFLPKLNTTPVSN